VNITVNLSVLSS